MEQTSNIDISLWISVGALVLAVPLGIASNLLTGRLINFLETRKLIKAHKTKQQALIVYQRIKDFHDGKRDRYPFYMLLLCASIIGAVVASTLIILAIHIETSAFQFQIVFTLLISALICALMSGAFLLALYETARQLERFDEYKSEFEKRFGLIDEQSRS